VETNTFWWKLILVETNLGGNYFGGNYFFGRGNYFLVEKLEGRIAKKEQLAI
jgi:hypothetical protein